MKVILELSIESQDKLNALVAIARIFELGSQADKDATDLLDSDMFWADHAPKALWELFGTIQYLLTSREWDKQNLRLLVGGDEWENVVSIGIDELSTIREMVKSLK